MQAQVVQVAVMQETIKKRQEDELNTMRFYRGGETNAFAVDVQSTVNVDEQAPIQVHRPALSSSTKSEPPNY
ncbi:hypothetical protein V7S43_009987 [Phytophthora oleae]|uniref:Uncharacterized protein n=1 Tax=Phytophthora oleae TaxID=2107226 RepID=A0ABD3FFX4_9STRA